MNDDQAWWYKRAYQVACYDIQGYQLKTTANAEVIAREIHNAYIAGVSTEGRDEIARLRELVHLADNIREAQRQYMADRGNGVKGAAVGAAATAYDEARSAYKGEK